MFGWACFEAVVGNQAGIRCVSTLELAPELLAILVVVRQHCQRHTLVLRVFCHRSGHYFRGTAGAGGRQVWLASTAMSGSLGGTQPVFARGDRCIVG